MIASLHVASGAAAGRALGSRAAALAVGPLLHALGDAIPHEDIYSVPFELGTGLGIAAALALRHGPLSPTVLGAVAAAAPDVEHVVRLPRPGGRKLFPTHWGLASHGHGLPVAVQLALAALLLGYASRR